jgi:hypothetical protein
VKGENSPRRSVNLERAILSSYVELAICPAVNVEGIGYGVFNLSNGKGNTAVNVEGSQLPGFPVLKV